MANRVVLYLTDEGANQGVDSDELILVGGFARGSAQISIDGSDLLLIAGNDVDITADDDVTITSADDLIVDAGGLIDIDAGSSISLTSVGDLLLSSSGPGGIQTITKLSTTSTSSVSAINIGSVAGDPSTLVNGDIWYNSSTNKFRKRENGISSNFVSSNSVTFVVHPTAGVGDYTTIQAALNAIQPLGGGSIIVREGSYNELLTFPADCPIVLSGCGEKTILAPTSAGEIFAFPNGLTKITHVVIQDMAIQGNSAVAQTLNAYKDANSYWRLTTFRLKVTGVRVIDDVQDVDSTFTRVQRIYHYKPIFTPTTTVGVNKLAKSAASVGSYDGGISIIYRDALLGRQEETSVGGWSASFDGDFILDGNCELDLDGNLSCDGFQSIGTTWINQVVGTGTLEFFGASWIAGDGNGAINLAGALTLKLSGGQTQISALYMFAANTHLVLNGTRCDVNIHQGPSITGVVVDVLSGADRCIIRGTFTDSTTASIRTAAQKTVISGCTFAQSVGKTVIESGAADFTVIDGCTGLNGGTGLTLLGAGTTVNGVKSVSASGSTSGSYVELFTHANPKGVVGIGTIKNTGGSNDMQVKETVTDAYGVTDATTVTTVSPGDDYLLDPQTDFGSARPPYVSYKVEIKHPTAITTYSMRHTTEGAL